MFCNDIATHAPYKSHAALARPYLGHVLSMLPSQSDDIVNLMLGSSSSLGEFIRHCADKSESNRLSIVADYVNQFGACYHPVIEPLVEESHCGGCVVSKVSHPDELVPPVVAYSSLRATPRAFSETLNYLAQQFGTNVRSRKMVGNSLGSFVYREFIADSAIDNLELALYRYGILVAVAHFLMVTDAHCDNIVFSANTPVIIDDECQTTPVRQTQLLALSPNFGGAGSVLRTLLVPNPNVSPKNIKNLANGASRLKLSEASSDSYNELICGYIECMKYLKSSVLDIRHILLTNSSNIRYLLRSTRFYSVCKDVIGTCLFRKIDPRKDLYNLFARESNLFPELDTCIPFEINSLLLGDTPYFLLRQDNGDLIEPVTNNTVTTLVPPIQFIENHWNDLLQVDTDHLAQSLRPSTKALTN